MKERLKLSFVWQGVSDSKVFNHWNDGLRIAMRKIEKQYTVYYQEPWEEIRGDIILYWEAPVSAVGGNAVHYNRIRTMEGKKKILLFAGGAINYSWIEGFDHICVESKINCEELCVLQVPHSTAFGINDEIFKPVALTKQYDGIHQGTCASWKRQWLVGEAVGNRGLLVGRRQESDQHPFNEAEKYGTKILEEQPYEEVARLLNESHVMLQTADYWGGGQRATLEAMACGVQVVVMSDSPKNCQYVNESGFGLIVEPNAVAIRNAVEELRQNPHDVSLATNYIKENWTGKIYANSLLSAIEKVMS